VEYSSDCFHDQPLSFEVATLMQEFVAPGDSTLKFFAAVTFSNASAFTLMYSNNRGEFVEGSEERSGRAASH
jgi:hypothetical protein